MSEFKRFTIRRTLVALRASAKSQARQLVHICGWGGPECTDSHDVGRHSRGSLRSRVLVRPKFVNVPELFFRQRTHQKWAVTPV